MPEEKLVVDLSGAGLVPARVIRKLHMRDELQVRLYRPGKVSLHDLHVIDVVLHEEIVRPYRGDDIHGLLRVGQEKPGDVARVDGLHQELDASCREPRRSELQIADQGFAGVVRVASRRADAGKTVDLLAAERGCILDRLVYTV